ncbi:sulfurtransferase [Sinirhodobacter populi]|uniref:Sulfurtransferase n=1 Tax=Paenirhodobacter populi TaxID=2306993 RepID=A0A443KM92_9RHOB|nr:rhodanese-like domain-containing protein [Sinirhodobacter populi]RWR33719.1 sulfurtransferase [Sinirhodobacter populi]
MKQILLALAVAFAAVSPLGARTFGPLVTPTEIEAAAPAPIILDTRGPAYEQGHIPGAISAPYGLFRGPAENPGALVPVDELQSRLRALGLTKDRPIVIVHQGKDDSDFGSAARVYWTLKSSGFTDLSILNGGMNAWLAAGLPVETEKVVPVPSEVTITFSDEWLATTDDVAKIVEGKETAQLIDARPTPFFEGKQAHEVASRPGTLPGAESVPHSQFFVGGSPAIGGETTAKDVAAKLGLKQGEEVVSFCNTGHWAATDWFALSELAGVPDVKLYPDSMVGYSQTDLPMQNTPGLWQNLKRQLGGN